MSKILEYVSTHWPTVAAILAGIVCVLHVIKLLLDIRKQWREDSQRRLQSQSPPNPLLPTPSSTTTSHKRNGSIALASLAAAFYLGMLSGASPAPDQPYADERAWAVATDSMRRDAVDELCTAHALELVSWIEPIGTPVLRHEATGIEMVLILGRGPAPDDREASEDGEGKPGPMRPFLIARTEVTEAQWQRIQSSQPAPSLADAELPVALISWNAATEYCDAAGLALPTERQWQRACLAGSDTAYCFGDAPTRLLDHGWYFRNSGSNVLPENTLHEVSKLESWGCRRQRVGTRKANAFGLFDTHGNMWEWCREVVLAGGCYLCSATACTATARRREPNIRRDETFGFRPVIEL